jgi:hypothetical protein
VLSVVYLSKLVNEQSLIIHRFAHLPGWVVVRSSSANALGQVVDDHRGSGIGSERHRGTVKQTCTATAGTNGERFALLVCWEFALGVALLDRFDASDALERRSFDLGRDGSTDALDRALRRLALEDWGGKGQGNKSGECGELHVGFS